MTDEPLRLGASTAEREAQARAKACVEKLFADYPTGPVRGSIWIDEAQGFAEVSAFAGCLHISSVFVLPAHRRQGRGRAIMRVLLDAAAEAGVGVTLTPVPFGDDQPMSSAQLARWYKSLGFVPERNGDDLIKPPPDR